jgi:hypothetical protein
MKEFESIKEEDSARDGDPSNVSECQVADIGKATVGRSCSEKENRELGS